MCLGGKLGKYVGRFLSVVGTADGTSSSSSDARSSGEGEREGAGTRVAGPAFADALVWPVSKDNEIVHRYKG